MSERSSGDPKICEIVVDKVERKDLGKWRSKVSTFKIGFGIQNNSGVWQNAGAAAVQKEHILLCRKPQFLLLPSPLLLTVNSQVVQ